MLISTPRSTVSSPGFWMGFLASRTSLEATRRQMLNDPIRLISTTVRKVSRSCERKRHDYEPLLVKQILSTYEWLAITVDDLDEKMQLSVLAFCCRDLVNPTHLARHGHPTAVYHTAHDNLGPCLVSLLDRLDHVLFADHVNTGRDCTILTQLFG